MITFDRQKLTTAVELKKGDSSLRDVAGEIGIDAGTLNRLINDKTSLEIETLVKIINWLKMPVNCFFKKAA